MECNGDCYPSQYGDPPFTALLSVENGEKFARSGLQMKWYRGFTRLVWEAELQRNGILAVLKAMADEGGNAGANDADGNEEKKGKDIEYIDTGAAVARVQREFRMKRELDVVICDEGAARAEAMREEHDVISLFVIMMEEFMERLSLLQEVESKFALILNVMKPRVCCRYVYAWGVRALSTFKPSASALEQLRPVERHKPSYLRSQQPSCRVPLEVALGRPDGGRKLAKVTELDLKRAV